MGVRTELPLSGDLQAPRDLAAPHLRNAGLAWLDMAVALFAQEAFSKLTLSWHRDLQGEPKLVIVLDSSKNHSTKRIRALPGAPTDRVDRRRALDEAVKKLLARTTPEELWAALANSRLADITAWDMDRAWWEMCGRKAPFTYPCFAGGHEFLCNWLVAVESRGAAPAPSHHPWI